MQLYSPDDDAGVPAATAAVHARPNPALAAPSINLSSVKEATGNFYESNIIGRGGFGIVYQVCTFFNNLTPLCTQTKLRFDFTTTNLEMQSLH